MARYGLEPMKNRFRILLCLAAMTFVADDSIAQPAGFNYDEDKVPQYSLPDPLNLPGVTVKSVRDWETVGRPAVMALFEEHVYGKTPSDEHVQVSFKVFNEDRKVLGGKAVRKQVRATFTGNGKSVDMDILIYLPQSETPSPVFIGLNFYGNHTITDDPAVRLNQNWMRSSKDKAIVDHKATEASRGTSSSRWPVEQIIARGYGVATIYCGDIDPDFHDEFQNGIHPLFYKNGQTKPDYNEWGTIGAWSWGVSRAMDYFETDGDIDHTSVALMGHSRLGKTSLWGGAQDERFAIVISNNSGCGGAALSRRRFGETVKRINDSFPHWFNSKFKLYNDDEDALPVDQHMLMALIAPRPLYVASAVDDKWADPKGEFLSAKHAEPVYALYGLKGLGVAEQPAVDQSVGDQVAYHVRTGGHDVKDYDWQSYMNFADRHFGRGK